jgi:hypothetical protein
LSFVSRLILGIGREAIESRLDYFDALIEVLNARPCFFRTCAALATPLLFPLAGLSWMTADET